MALATRFPWILQRYIFREMGRTFLLTAIALTGVLGLGGGVMNMIKLGDVTPEQLLELMVLVLPVAAALTLPIAALFSAAATYGRLGADNEFVACRSGGINLHVLFLPTVLLGLVSAAITFVFISFVIPSVVRNLNEFVSADIGAIVQRRLDRPRGITLGGRFRVYADETTIELAEEGHVVLHRVAFVEVDGDRWVRFGTARSVDLVFSQADARMSVAGSMTGLSYYDRNLGQFCEEAQQLIPRNELPSLVPREIKFLNLGELFHYWSQPDEWGEVREELDRLRSAVGCRIAYDSLWTDWFEDNSVTLEDERLRVVISSAAAARLPRQGGIELVNVVIEEHARGRDRSFTAERAILEVSRGSALPGTSVKVVAYDVKVADGTREFSRSRETIGPVAIPAELVERIERLPTQELLQVGAAGSPDDTISDKWAAALGARAETVRKIAATISQRLAFSASVLVLVILGAALGIVFRGSHVLTAFGISFAPSLLVIVTIITGKQMAHNAPTHLSGLLLMWSGIVLVAALDCWVLTRLLRR